MSKIENIETKLNNEMAITFSEITEKDAAVSLMSDAFKKIFGAEFSLGSETTLTLQLKYDKDDLPILKCKASIKQINVHNEQLELFDFKRQLENVAGI